MNFSSLWHHERKIQKLSQDIKTKEMKNTRRMLLFFCNLPPKNKRKINKIKKHAETFAPICFPIWMQRQLAADNSTI